MRSTGTTLGGTLLVAGTCIGAGALGLPVLTAGGGFIPAILLFLGCWVTMACTGLLFLEICLWMEPGSNIVTMAHRILGRPGQLIAWILYLYLFYSLTVAYVSGSGEVVGALFDEGIPRWTCILIFMAIFAPLVYIGPRAVDRTNLILVAGLGLTYVGFLALGMPHVEPILLTHINWAKAWVALPVILVSFGYQGLLPTLTDYLERKPRKIRAAILMGSFLPLIGYFLFEWLILGSVPPEELSAAQTFVGPLRKAIDVPAVFLVAEFFAFFALTSSFLGVTLAMRDFLSDGLRIQKDRRGRLLLCSLIFLPALLLALTDPGLFITALRYGGGVGGALLLGALPIIMVWVGRYIQKRPSIYRMKGGRPALVLLALVVILVLTADILADWI